MGSKGTCHGCGADLSRCDCKVSLEDIFTGIKKPVTLKLVSARVEMLFQLMTGMQNEIDMLADRTNVLAARIKEEK